MLPSGIITIWSGAVVDIPGGWLLCDGTSGTPDLRDRFVQGAGGALNPNATGGASTHNHNFTTDGHFHNFPAGITLLAGSFFSNITTTDVDTATTDDASSIPPFFALAFIMKS